MKFTKEKLSYLLFLYQKRNKNYTSTRFSQEMGISKATFSRILNVFYQEGLTEKKGKGVLSSRGCEIAKSYLKEIDRLSIWLKKTTNFNDDEVYQEAISLIISLLPKTRIKLINSIIKEDLFDALDNIKKINGDMLSNYLDDGLYHFAFTIYKIDMSEISMANDGFFHPGMLEIKRGQGKLIFKTRETEKELNNNMILRGRAATLQYEIDQEFIECNTIQEKFYIPISKLYFWYSKEERILQTTVKIKITSTVGDHYMPESMALINIIFK